MDFFDHQEAARRRSLWLSLWFVLAVAAVCVMMCGLVFLACAAGSLLVTWGTGDAVPTGPGPALLPIPIWQPKLYAWTSGITAGFILLMSLMRMRQLAAGGRTVAKLIGARLMDPASPKREERVFVDVVEEMALAAGAPVPELYVLPGEWALNSFVAGRTLADAALFVTEGALVRFDRDQLQAMVAHEFSHLLCGDMRLNLKLMGLVHGLFAINLLGEGLLGPGAATGRRDSGLELGALSATAGRRKNLGSPETADAVRGLGALLLAAIGLVVALVGWNGAFFGRIITGWVAREREFLADAAALQFTRHPEALIGLLATANAWPQGGVLRVRGAAEFSHMCLLQVLPGEASWMTSTHPPLPERILRVEQMGGRIVGIKVPKRELKAEPAAIPMSAPPPAPLPTIGAGELLAQAGLPVASHLAWSANWLAKLSPELRTAAHEPAGAEAVVDLLLLRNCGGTHAALRADLAAAAPPAVAQSLRTLSPRVAALNDFDAIPLLELCLPALRAATPPDYQRLMQSVQRITQADRQVDLFEFALQRMLRRHLAPTFAPGSTTVNAFSTAQLPQDCSVLLSLLAHAGAAAGEARDAFDQGSKELREIRHQLDLLPVEECGLGKLEAALDRAAAAPPDWKRKILAACAAAAASDGTLTAREAELLRAFADAFDCPVPPLIPQ